MAAGTRKKGFTLLEVMVAVAILAIALTAIFGSQAGAIRVGARARHTTTATLLARCKMGEIEEHLITDGFPAVHESGEDECCEDAEHEGFSCEWTVERVELPDQVDTGEGGDLLGLGGLGGTGEGGAGDVESALAGAAGGDMIGGIAVQAAWPVLRPHIEDQVRRATVTVRWGEGESQRSFDVVQYLVAEQGAADPNASGATPPGQTPPGQTPPPGQVAPNLPTTPRIPLPGFGR